MGFAGYTFFSLICFKNIGSEYSLELLRGGSNEHSKNPCFKKRNKENRINYHLINAVSQAMKYCIILCRQVNVITGVRDIVIESPQS